MAVNKKTKSEEFLEYIENDGKVDNGLPSVEAEFVEETNAEQGDWYFYDRIRLNELGDGDEYMGKPLLLPVETVQFDEEEDPRYRARLLLIDDDEEEYLQININLKTSDSIQSNVHNASALYALIAGLQNLQDPKWSTKFNRIRKVNIEDWQNYINNLESMNVKVVTKDGSSFTYNSFRIIEANKKD